MPHANIHARRCLVGVRVRDNDAFQSVRQDKVLVRSIFRGGQYEIDWARGRDVWRTWREGVGRGRSGHGGFRDAKMVRRRAWSEEELVDQEEEEHVSLEVGAFSSPALTLRGDAEREGGVEESKRYRGVGRLGVGAGRGVERLTVEEHETVRRRHGGVREGL